MCELAEIYWLYNQQGVKEVFSQSFSNHFSSIIVFLMAILQD